MLRRPNSSLSAPCKMLASKLTCICLSVANRSARCGDAEQSGELVPTTVADRGSLANVNAKLLLPLPDLGQPSVVAGLSVSLPMAELDDPTTSASRSAKAWAVNWHWPSSSARLSSDLLAARSRVPFRNSPMSARLRARVSARHTPHKAPSSPWWKTQSATSWAVAPRRSPTSAAQASPRKSAHRPAIPRPPSIVPGAPQERPGPKGRRLGVPTPKSSRISRPK